MEGCEKSRLKLTIFLFLHRKHALPRIEHDQDDLQGTDVTESAPRWRVVLGPGARARFSAIMNKVGIE